MLVSFDCGTGARLGARKMQDTKMQNTKITKRIAVRKIAEPENAGHKSARFLKVGMNPA